jgi:hypothetical protein
VDGTYPPDDGPDDPFRAGRRGEGAHVAVVHAGPAPGAPGIHHPHLLLPVLLFRYHLEVRLQLHACRHVGFS